MGIIDKLRKGKKSESVLDSLIKKKKESKEKAEAASTEKPSDIEVRELKAEPLDNIAAPEDIGMQPVEETAKPVHEFRTEGMHEFSLDSLGADATDAGIKAGYKSKVNKLIDDNRIDEAIHLLQELKQKLAEQR
jgi:hypothetical protein